jgi:hypothetical protein
MGRPWTPWLTEHLALGTLGALGTLDKKGQKNIRHYCRDFRIKFGHFKTNSEQLLTGACQLLRPRCLRQSYRLCLDDPSGSKPNISGNQTCS